MQSINFKDYTLNQLKQSLESIDNQLYQESALEIYHLLVLKLSSSDYKPVYSSLGYEHNWKIDLFIWNIPIIGSLLTTLLLDQEQLEQTMYFKLLKLDKLSNC